MARKVQGTSEERWRWPRPISREQRDQSVGVSFGRPKKYAARPLSSPTALPTETKVESGTSESKSGTSVKSSNSGVQGQGQGSGSCSGFRVRVR